VDGDKSIEEMHDDILMEVVGLEQENVCDLVLLTSQDML